MPCILTCFIWVSFLAKSLSPNLHYWSTLYFKEVTCLASWLVSFRLVSLQKVTNYFLKSKTDFIKKMLKSRWQFVKDLCGLKAILCWHNMNYMQLYALCLGSLKIHMRNLYLKCSVMRQDARRLFWTLFRDYFLNICLKILVFIRVAQHRLARDWMV